MSEQLDYVAQYEEEEVRIKNRFLEEIDKILQKRPATMINGQEIRTHRDYNALVGNFTSFLSQLKAGRYKVNIRVLWITRKYFPEFDYEYVLFGTRTKSKSSKLKSLESAPRSRPV